jgi:sortase A
MRDKRPVDELSIEELERILAIKKREARQQRLQKMERGGRLVQNPAPEPLQVESAPAIRVSVPVLEPINPPAGAATNNRPAPIIADVAPHFEDGDDEPVQVYAIPQKSNQGWKRVLDRVLLLVEVAAVIGIVVIGISLFDSIRTLERETASAQALADEQRRLGIPTIAPTPSLRLEDYVLPTGHVFNADGSVQFNYNEVPAHLQALVQSEWVQPVVSRPPTTSETAVNLTVPALDLDQSIVQGVDWEALKQGVGQLPNGVNPGDASGNLVLAAHDDVWGEIFRDLDQLEPGDQFQIATRSTLYTYTVTAVEIVEPTDVSVLENRGSPTATLISCYPYRVNTQRIVVTADRVA